MLKICSSDSLHLSEARCYNFDARKNVVEYDDVIAKQREVIYADRRAVLERADLHERVLGMIRAEVERIVDTYAP